MITNAIYLGFQIYSKLNWNKHIDTTKTKALDLLSIAA